MGLFAKFSIHEKFVSFAVISVKNINCNRSLCIVYP